MHRRSSALDHMLEELGPMSDRELFDAMARFLSEGGCIELLSHHNMADPLPPDLIERLRDFLASQSRPEVRFDDRAAERSRRSLLRSLKDLLAAVDKHMAPDVCGNVSVPGVLVQEDPGRFDVAVYNLNRLADKCVGVYGDFVRTCEDRL